jgi:hypothetical protein
MNLDLTTLILFAIAVVLGIAYFTRRALRLKRQHRKL